MTNYIEKTKHLKQNMLKEINSEIFQDLKESDIIFPSPTANVIRLHLNKEYGEIEAYFSYNTKQPLRSLPIEAIAEIAEKIRNSNFM